MPAVTLRTLRPDVAAELNRLETGAAMLERDARNSHATLVELGFVFTDVPSPFHAWETARFRALRGIARTWRTLHAAGTWLERTARSPRTATALRLARRCAMEGVAYVLIAGGLLIPFTLAILVLAPPV
jgi:hypothetical protein